MRQQAKALNDKIKLLHITSNCEEKQRHSITSLNIITNTIHKNKQKKQYEPKCSENWQQI